MIDDISKEVAQVLFEDKKKYIPLWIPLYIVFIAMPYSLIKLLLNHKKNKIT